MKDEWYPDPLCPVGERILYFRKKKGINSSQLAALARLTPSYLRELELNRKNPTVNTVVQICKALGISLKQFFYEEESEVLLSDPVALQIFKLDNRQRTALSKLLDSIENPE